MAKTAAIVSFMKWLPQSTVASQRITSFIRDELQLEVFDDEKVANVSVDKLIIINGAFAFCDFLPELAEAILQSKEIIWVQNDYTIFPPNREGKAESPFRKAFVTREELGLPRVKFWSTCEDSVFGNPGSHYINWNQLTYTPVLSRGDLVERSLLYYGAYRENREEYFNRYFSNPEFPVKISSSSKKFSKYESDMVTVLPSMKERDGFFDLLGGCSLGLYLEDKKSHSSFHSPANRFYEMLSIGMPMLFQPESYRMMQKAGFDIAPYIIDKNDIWGFINRAYDNRYSIMTKQGQEWKKPYYRMLRQRLKDIWQREIKE